MYNRCQFCRTLRQLILKTFIVRSNLCTGSWYHDFNSQCVDEEFQMKMLKIADTSIGSPCYGDRGTSLMVKENKRSVSFSMSIHKYPSNHHWQVHGCRGVQQMQVPYHLIHSRRFRHPAVLLPGPGGVRENQRGDEELDLEPSSWGAGHAGLPQETD